MSNNKKIAYVQSRSRATVTSPFSQKTQLVVGSIGLIGLGLVIYAFSANPKHMELALIGFVLIIPSVIFGSRGPA